MKDEKFSWVETHEKIVQFISTKENSQQDLIDLLKAVGIGPFNDKANPGDHNIELDEIDPFTFFCYIYKYGSKRRLQYLQKIAAKLNLKKPLGDFGIPSAQAQKVWLFPYKYQRTNNEISTLWNLFNKELNGQISDQDFEDALQIRSTGKTKLTEALFYINPEKYLPINGPTKPYIKEQLKIDPNFTSYTEYLDLLSKIKQKIDVPFYELSGESWKWNDERKKVNYWIFQGNPNVFDFQTALRDDLLTDWTVSAHKDKIKPGDQVILWITGSKSGCYALAEVTSEPHEKTSSPDDHLWKTEDKSILKADIKITHNLVDSPIFKSKVDSVKKLKDLKVGNQGTNFTATEAEFKSVLKLLHNSENIQYWLYAPGDEARKWEEFYADGIMGLGWDEIGDLKQYRSRDEIKEALVNSGRGQGSQRNSALANDDFLNKINIGDVIIAKKGKSELLGYGVVTSEYAYDNNRTEYQKQRQVDWKLKGNWKLDSSLPLKTLTKTDKTNYEKLLGVMGQNTKIDKFKDLDFPLNTILYGPPGTGKTYNTILRAAEIIENRKIDLYKEAQDIFKENLHDRIEFITFHQNYSYEDFIQGLRPDTENDNQLTFERKDGVFKEIADRALKNIKESEKPELLKRPFDEVFNQFVNPLTEGEVEEIEVKMKIVSYFITAITNRSIDFRKASGESAHSLSIGTLRRMYSAESTLEIQGLASYYKPLLRDLLKLGKDSSVQKEKIDRQNYVIIIDEINRANISRVFGELITLIEPDKRYGGDIPIEARLPSGDPFIVPPNLYIIGTMNTADKSIALLDIALRRRFEFESMYPKYDIDGIYDTEILKKINIKISDSKGPDFQIGHAYFMGDNKDLVKRMNKKVIPLLLEYYMNDEKEVKGILESAGLVVEKDSWPLKIEGTSD